MNGHFSALKNREKGNESLKQVLRNTILSKQLNAIKQSFFKDLEQKAAPSYSKEIVEEIKLAVRKQMQSTTRKNNLLLLVLLFF